MAEEAQELVVDNPGQPLYAEVEPAETLEVADGMIATEPASQTITIDPAAD